MSVYKGENVIAGGSVDTYFVRKPAWSQAVAITAASIAAGYTVPEDGIMIIPYFQTNSGVSGFKRVYINGTVVVASAFGDGSETRPSSAQITVNAGDVITADSGSSVSDAATFVPFEDSTIAEPEVVTPELIRNLHDPDWSQAIAVSAADLYAGYTAPKRGMFVCTGVMPLANDSNVRMITVNNVPIVKGQYLHSGEYSYGNASCPVNAGDLIKSNINSAWGSETRYFVPYKAQ